MRIKKKITILRKLDFLSKIRVTRKCIKKEILKKAHPILVDFLGFEPSNNINFYNFFSLLLKFIDFLFILNFNILATQQSNKSTLNLKIYSKIITFFFIN